MKNFIPKCFLFILSIVLISSTLFAQGPRNPGKDPYDSSNNIISAIPVNFMLSPKDNPAVYLAEKPEGIQINKNRKQIIVPKSFFIVEELMKQRI
ncbi:MAG: hypothetical protein Q8891_10895 [Bacteroidota bacterium]|nr:hypothetical protein [Bacteroidota bacterium]